MSELKPLRKKAVPAALEKARHYRLLNEPRQAESICLDILAVDEDNQEALVLLVLSLSDQLERRSVAGIRQARQCLKKIEDDYTREYYDGILCERFATLILKTALPRYQYDSYAWLKEAMEHYANAEKLADGDNDEAVLRWNTCVRILERHPELEAAPEEPETEHMLE